MKRNAIFVTVLGFIVFASPSLAVNVTPGDLGSPGDLNKWYRTNYRTTPTYSSTTVAAITANQPRSGSGSVEMSSTDATGKADFEFVWGFISGRTLGNLTGLGFDWYRDSASTANAILAPALRLLYDADGSVATTEDRGYLIWEYTYSHSGAAPTGSWQTQNVLGENFWMREFSPGETIELYNKTLNDWMTSSPFTALGLTSDTLTASTAILGINFGIGSGWAGTFEGYVDNVSWDWASESPVSYNFEVSVPDAGSTLALLGAALVGLGGASRKWLR